MNNLFRLRKGIIEIYMEHGVYNGYSPEMISRMINEIDFFALYQCLRASSNTNHLYRYFACGNNGCGYYSESIFPDEVIELCSVVDYDRKEDDCRIRHSIDLVLREDMSLAVLSCCETVVGDGDYVSAYRELKEEWPFDQAIIDLEKFHRRIMAFFRGYDSKESAFCEP